MAQIPVLSSVVEVLAFTKFEEKDGNFYHLLYPVKETGEMLELATTRP